MGENKVRVSAIVSTYNSERFFRGKIEDLLAQTLWERGELEIVVVISGSKQYEGLIAREYLRKGVPLTIITTPREPIYTAWVRGIRLAQGALVCNSNCDDRLAPTAYERFADTLDAHPDVGVVYADSWVTNTVNATWENFEVSTAPPYESGRLEWGDFNAPKLARFCCIGQTPMWRKALHDAHGYFDESFLLAGDYEFWLRLCAQGVRFKHLNDTLSLFYYADNATTVNQEQSNMEARRALLRWRDQIANL